jgi:hypothetical protein
MVAIVANVVKLMTPFAPTRSWPPCIVFCFAPSRGPPLLGRWFYLISAGRQKL